MGLELRSEYELGREYTVRINRRSRQNISGRYGPDKDRFIQIPNYQRRRIFGDYDQRKVLAAVANIPEFNWVIEGLTGNYTTTLTKMTDDEFKVIQRKLRALKLRMVEYRSTYFDIAYRIIPNENSEEVHGYSRSRYV